jgi:hypothetical protein
MSDRLPPAIAVFFSETIRRRVMSRLPAAAAACVSSIRYDPSSTIAGAFVDELSQAMTKAAERLRPDVSPALAVVLVTDPMKPAPVAEILGLIRRACPPNVEFAAQWLGVFKQEAIPAWTRLASDGVVFLLSTAWRGGLVQGGSLDRAYLSLVLSVLATETSRVAPADFDCFARLRFHSPGKIYKVAIDPVELPDFDQQADQSLRLSALSSYFPQIHSRALGAAVRVAPVELGPVLNSLGSRLALEPSIAEPLLCAAISRSVSIAQAGAMLGDWASTAREPVGSLLRDMQTALSQWAIDAGAFDYSKADSQLAEQLFALSGFPLLHELKMRLTAHRSQLSFRNQAAILKSQFAVQKRADLDRDYYELLPNELNALQRLAIAADLARANGSAARLTVTRHFPSDLISDTREEILDLRGLTTVLYAMEMRSE